MPFAQKLSQFTQKAAAVLPHTDAGTPSSGRILVVEHTPGDGWKALDAEIGEDIAILDARTVEGGDQHGAAALLSTSDGATIALIPDSHKSVCRLIDIASAPADQVERMVALRLEVELPYPVAESTWACEPCLNGRGSTSRALLIAAATSEISKAERALGAPKSRGVGIEFGPAGLAELALAAVPAEGTVAVVAMDAGEALLVLTYGGTLAYTRHIRLDPAAQDLESPMDKWAPQFARDVKQSLYDYLLRTGNSGPECIYMVGKPMRQEALLEAITQSLGMPVRSLAFPGVIRVAKPELNADDLIADFPVCLGILIATMRRRRGERTTSPAIRRERRGFRALDWRSRIGVLVGLSVLLGAALVASLFMVQAVRLNADERLVRESQPLLGGLQGLQEEADILRFEGRQARSIVDTIAALAEVLPAEIKVESVAIDAKGKVTIAGKANSVEVASDTAISALEASSAFVNPQFNGATREKDAFGFHITFDLAN